MEIIHMVHLVGEYNEVIGVFANTLFAISLVHGGHHWVMVHVRRWRISKRRGVRETLPQKINELA